jgi:hypothetical protein
MPFTKMMTTRLGHSPRPPLGPAADLGIAARSAGAVLDDRGGDGRSTNEPRDGSLSRPPGARRTARRARVRAEIRSPRADKPRRMVGGVDQQQLPALAAPGRLGDDPADGQSRRLDPHSANGVDSYVAPSRSFSPRSPSATRLTSFQALAALAFLRGNGLIRRGYPRGGPRRGGMSSVFHLRVGHSGARIPREREIAESLGSG